MCVERATMNPLAAPKIVFHPWVSWAQRLTIKGCNLPGVYLLAQFDQPPLDPVEHTAQEVVYIGETCNRKLTQRWYEFGRSAFEAKYGHSAGWPYCDKCYDQGEQLYVSAFPVQDLSGEAASHFIRYVERKLLWEFVCRWGHAPVCNRK